MPTSDKITNWKKSKQGSTITVGGVERKITAVSVEVTNGAYVIRVALNRRGRPFTTHGKDFDDAREAMNEKLRDVA